MKFSNNNKLRKKSCYKKPPKWPNPNHLINSLSSPVFNKQHSFPPKKMHHGFVTASFEIRNLNPYWTSHIFLNLTNLNIFVIFFFKFPANQNTILANTYQTQFSQRLKFIYNHNFHVNMSLLWRKPV
jgi:hypothetical protein